MVPDETSNECPALRDVKISNKLREFDSWYQDSHLFGPIPVEATGASIRYKACFREGEDTIQHMLNAVLDEDANKAQQYIQSQLLANDKEAEGRRNYMAAMFLKGELITESGTEEEEPSQESDIPS